MSLAQKGELSFYLPDILIKELFGFVRGKGLVDGRKEKLIAHCLIINSLNCSKIFKPIIKIIDDKLNGITDKVFSSEEIEKSILETILDFATSGGVSEEKLEKIRFVLEDSKNYNEAWKIEQELHLPERIKELDAFNEHLEMMEDDRKIMDTFFSKGFKFFYSQMNDGKINYAYNLLNVNKIAATKERLKEVIDNPKYLYINAWLESRFALHYKYVRDRQIQVKGNDLGDIQYFFYAPEIDYLVSDDKLVSEIGEMVYNSKKVLTFDEFSFFLNKTL